MGFQETRLAKLSKTCRRGLCTDLRHEQDVQALGVDVVDVIGRTSGDV